MPPRLWILIQAFAHLLPPGDVIDAGANDGPPGGVPYLAMKLVLVPTYLRSEPRGRC